MKTKEENAAYMRAYRAANKEKLTEQRRARDAARRDEIAAYMRDYRAAHPQKCAAATRKYYANHREWFAEYNRKRYIKMKSLTKPSATRHGEKWTAEDDAAVQSGRGAVQIAQELGRTAAAVYARMNWLRLGQENPE